MDPQELNPEGLSSAEFLEKHRFVVIPGLLDPLTVEFLSSYYSVMEFDETGRFGRDNTSINAYGDGCADLCMYILRDRLEKEISIELVPGFSFVRHYKEGDKLKRHNDRPSNEINVTATITADVDWPIGFCHKFGGETHILTTKPGDAVVYFGNELEHWRDRYTGQNQVQLINGYVVKGGRFDTEEIRFDGHGGPVYNPFFVRPQPVSQTIHRKLFILWRNLKHRLGLPEYKD